jgi:hypothetical protein
MKQKTRATEGLKTFIEALILGTLMFVIPLTVWVIRTGKLLMMSQQWEASQDAIYERTSTTHV